MLLAATEGVLQHRCASNICYQCLQAQASSLGGTMLREWPRFRVLREEYPNLSAEVDVVTDLLGAMCSLQWLPAAPPWILACAWSTPLECPVRLKKLVKVPLEEPSQLRLLQHGRWQHERRRRLATCMWVHVLGTTPASCNYCSRAHAVGGDRHTQWPSQLSPL